MGLATEGTATTGSNDGSYNNVSQILSNGAALEVYLHGFPSNATEGLWNTGLYVTAEEEDLIDAHQQGIIDDMAFEQGMAELGRTTATVG